MRRQSKRAASAAASSRRSFSIFSARSSAAASVGRALRFELCDAAVEFIVCEFADVAHRLDVRAIGAVRFDAHALLQEPQFLVAKLLRLLVLQHLVCEPRVDLHAVGAVRAERAEVHRPRRVEVACERSEALVEWKGLTSQETGRFVYRAEIAPPSGEPPSPERHQKSLPVEVLGERTRVLLLSGGANHEFQILRNLLLRDKTIDVSCWLQSAART